ncbi:putative l-allo-threonine aldolase [Diplodia seriata]|uniref:Putative l-allo-threonine aldolase n=1 Tax=Diplodia seriata TaxID=420778 RepID=A0A0G2E1Q0_9PEZI|nr:putative l-allo-threonine aldolase [Diplodia seriata]
MSPHNYYPVTAPSSSCPTPAGISPSQSPSINHWTTPGPASSDFRSDTITTPTASMLAAIASTTLGDDVFHEDATTNALQSWIASLLGKPAALLVMSGTMGNQVALRTHLGGPPHSVLCDHRAHILRAEAGGVAALCGAQIEGVFPSNGSYLTLEDVQANAVLGDDTFGTRIVVHYQISELAMRGMEEVMEAVMGKKGAAAAAAAPETNGTEGA